jgi:hypothetical protein
MDNLYNRRPQKPLHWLVIMLFLSLVTGWLLNPYKSPTVEYIHPLHYSPMYIRRTFDGSAGKQRTLQELRRVAITKCGEQDLLIGFDFQFDGIPCTDHVFHICNSKTIVGGVIEPLGNDKIICNEEYAGVFRTVERFARIKLIGTNVGDFEITETEMVGKDACIVQHAMSILDGIW